MVFVAIVIKGAYVLLIYGSHISSMLPKYRRTMLDIIHGDCILRPPIPAPNPELIAIGFYLLFLCLVLGIF